MMDQNITLLIFNKRPAVGMAAINDFPIIVFFICLPLSILRNSGNFFT